MQQALNSWEEGLRLTGGALAPDKCCWYLIDFVWEDGCWRYATMVERLAALTALNNKGERITIKRLDVTQSQRALGVRGAPDGTFFDELEYLKEKAQEWAEQIRVGFLDRATVLQAFHTTIMRTLHYPLSVTNFTKAQCEEITGPLMKVVLPWVGVVRTIPGALAYGCKFMGGIGFPHLFVSQGKAHIHKILRFSGQPGISGNLLTGTYEQLKLEIGLPGRILSTAYDRWSVIATPCWLTTTWSFLSSHGLRIEDPERFLPLAREQDEY